MQKVIHQFHGYKDENSKTIIKKYIRVKDDDEIKWGAKVIVR